MNMNFSKKTLQKGLKLRNPFLKQSINIIKTQSHLYIKWQNDSEIYDQEGCLTKILRKAIT